MDANYCTLQSICRFTNPERKQTYYFIIKLISNLSKSNILNVILF